VYIYAVYNDTIKKFIGRTFSRKAYKEHMSHWATNLPCLHSYRRKRTSWYYNTRHRQYQL